MITVLVLVFAVVAALLIRAAPGQRLDAVERWYLGTSPLPAVLALGLPGPASLIGDTVAARRLGAVLTQAGLWASIALLAIGIGLVVRRTRRSEPVGPVLLFGIVLASLPVVMVSVTALLFSLH